MKKFFSDLFLIILGLVGFLFIKIGHLLSAASMVIPFCIWFGDVKLFIWILIFAVLALLMIFSEACFKVLNFVSHFSVPGAIVMLLDLKFTNVQLWVWILCFAVIFILKCRFFSGKRYRTIKS